MKKLELKSRKLLRTLFGCFSFTAIAFIFQACYGTPEDDFCDIKLTGTVTSKTTNAPISGIKITVHKGVNYGITDKNGNFNFYASVSNWHDSASVNFLDIDGNENGLFADTTIVVKHAKKDELIIHMELTEK